jgi:hypothetical protein
VRTTRSLAALFLLELAATAARGADLPTQPDPHLTPGVVATTDEDEVCVRDAAGHFVYSREHRVGDAKVETLRRYGLPESDRGLVEDDDRVPICLGGDNADPLNHWPEPWSQARRKDQIEWRICRAVCDGRMSLSAAQAYFLGLDWLRRSRDGP